MFEATARTDRIWSFDNGFVSAIFSAVGTNVEHDSLHCRVALPLKPHRFFFSVQPLCALCLCGHFAEQHLTTETQSTQRWHRESQARHY